MLKYFIKRIFLKIKRELFYLFNVMSFRYLGKNSYIKNSCLIGNKKYICLSKNIFIRDNVRIEAVMAYAGQVYSPEIIIEDDVSIEQNLNLTCAERIVIGKNTAIAANVTITDIHHSYDDINIPIEHQKLKVVLVKIGNDCKIYNNAVILQGITIGNHVTVAANSVVIKNIPDYCVVVGVPAKIIKRYNFDRKQWERTNVQGDFLN